MLGAAALALLAAPACATRRRYPSDDMRFSSAAQRGAVQRGAMQRGGASSNLHWVHTAPPDTGVSAQFPAPPQIEASLDRDDDGARRYETTATAELPFGYFAVFVARWESGIVGNPLRTVSQVASAIFERAELTRERSRRLAVDGYYAREDFGTNEHGAHVTLRQYVGRDRVIVAVAIANPDAGEVSSWFLDSVGLDRQNALFPTGGGRRSDGRWTPLYIPESDFAVAMPAAPSISEAEVSVDGETHTMQVFQSRDAWGLYRVRVVSFGDHVPEGGFAALRRELHFGREVRPVHSSGFPGRVFVTDVGAQRAWARMFQTAGRVYIVEAIGERRTLTDRSTADSLLRYFDSFRILG